MKKKKKLLKNILILDNNNMNNFLKIFTLSLLSMFLVSCGLRPESVFKSNVKKQTVLRLDIKGHMGLISDIIVTKDKDIISASYDKTIRGWDKNGNEKRKILGELALGLEGQIYSIALSSDEKYLAVGGHFSNPNYIIRIYDYKTGKLFKILKSHKGSVISLSFSQDDKYIISSSNDTTEKKGK